MKSRVFNIGFVGYGLLCMKQNNSQQISPTFNLLIADDHELLREGVKSVFSDVPWARIAGEVNSAEEAFSFIENGAPDLVLLDPCFAGGDDLSFVRRICSLSQESKVLLLTDKDNDDWVYECLKAGIVGFILKKTSGHELVVGVQAVLEGKNYFSPDILMNVTRRFVQGKPMVNPLLLVDHLTKREREIFGLVGQGRKNREIAQDLYISIKTVEKHRANMMRKLRLKSPVQVRRLWSDWVASS